MSRPITADENEVYRAFQSLVQSSSMSYTRIASEVGVSDVTVRRWALGETRPKMSKMKEALDVIHARTTVTLDNLVEARRALDNFESQVVRNEGEEHHD